MSGTGTAGHGTRTHRIVTTEHYPEDHDDRVYGVRQTVHTETGEDAQMRYEPVLLRTDALDAVEEMSDVHADLADTVADETEYPPLVVSLSAGGSSADVVLAHYLDRADWGELPGDEYDTGLVSALRSDPLGTLVDSSGQSVADRFSEDAESVEDAALRLLPGVYQTYEDYMRRAEETMLSPRETECYVFKSVFGLTRSDVSHVLGVADNTVKTHLRKARSKQSEWEDERDEACRRAEEWESTGEFFETAEFEQTG